MIFFTHPQDEKNPYLIFVFFNWLWKQLYMGVETMLRGNKNGELIVGKKFPPSFNSD